MRIKFLLTCIPEEEPDCGWVFLHSVLDVGVQFLTISSSFSHLVHKQGKISTEGIKADGATAVIFSSWEIVCAWGGGLFAHFKHFRHSSHAWSGSQNLPGLHWHTVLEVCVHGLTISWPEKATWKKKTLLSQEFMLGALWKGCILIFLSQSSQSVV